MNNNEKVVKTCINWYPGHMAKTKRLINKNLNLIDIVLEIIDSRIPYSSKIIGLNELIKDKPKILIMTKYDLCDKEETKKWIAYYERLGYKVLKYNLLEDSINNIYDIIDETLEPLVEKLESKDLQKRKYRVLIIGIPNVCKSTLINKLVGKRSAKVGNIPGVTKGLSWIRSNPKIDLLDTPGLLYPKIESNEISYNLGAVSSIKEEILPIDEIAIHILNKLNDYYPNILKEVYNIDSVDDIVEILNVIGRNRGCLQKGNDVDYNKVYKLILKDIRDGKIKEITLDRYGG